MRVMVLPLISIELTQPFAFLGIAEYTPIDRLSAVAFGEHNRIAIGYFALRPAIPSHMHEIGLTPYAHGGMVFVATKPYEMNAIFFHLDTLPHPVYGRNT